MPAPMERFHLIQHGCKVSRHDAASVRAELARFGLAECGEGEAADLLVLNACAVTDRAVRRGRQAVRSMRRRAPGARVLVTGCMTDGDAGRYRELGEGMLVHPIAARDRLAADLAAFLGSAEPAGPPARLGNSAYPDRTRAFLRVQDGCDAQCAFCVIPQIRGAVKSRERAEILAEAAAFAARGFREIVLCGVHLGHYGRDSGDRLVDLARALLSGPGAFRVRLSSLEVTEVGADLAALLAAEPRLVPHLHVPLQSGDDGVLRAMRRPYTLGGYRRRIDDLRARVPDLALTTDVIAGFPGEGDAAFSATLDAVAALEFEKVHVFPYSPRAGTPAAELPDRVPAPQLRARVAALLRAERRQRELLLERRVGETAEVLIEHSGAEYSSGLSEHHAEVRLPGLYPRSALVRCRIVGRSGDRLSGEVAA